MQPLTINQTAAILGVHRSRVRQLIEQGRIKAKKLDARTWLVLDYSKALERKTGKPRSKPRDIKPKDLEQPKEENQADD